ncbi:hypothetical protein [Aeromicrobium sp. Leaf350]|uniref:hypothetical protein n=1 Tax=Aeromicrobium sp. Leaf350 TaxID=2876565 RepID=UPI001E5E02EF|nr:hypothetical protein [Aeromicrobium sp. Leaf350]
MTGLLSLTSVLAAAAIVVAAAIAWWSARPILHASIHRRSGDSRTRLVGRGALDAFARSDTLVVDPVGSITVGELRVVGVEPIDPEHDRSLRWFAGALQHGADDPVARAISRLSARGGATEVKHVPGLGTAGRVDRHPVRVGASEWIGLDRPPDDGWHQVVAVEVDGRALGSLTVADPVRDQAPGAVASLVADGWRVVLVAPSDAAVRHLSAAVPCATVVRDGPTLEDGTDPVVVARSSTALDLRSAAGAAVSDRLPTRSAGVAMEDVAIHHVAAVLRLLRGARPRLRAMRLGVLVVAAAGTGSLLLAPPGSPEVFAAVASVLALPAALMLPLARWT